MNIRLAGLVNDSIVDGPGYRFAVFVQGCPHHCSGCHNPQTHDKNGGYDGDTDDIIKKIRQNPLISGVTFSGGEPLDQPLPLLQLARQIKENAALNIWIYTGYRFEDLAVKSSEDESLAELLKIADVLVDGPFKFAERDISLPFRGSRNQRVIDLKATHKAGKIILYEDNF